MRGHADSIALKLACHDPGVHRKLVPGGQTARAVFEAVEQARVEAIGARRMSGVAKNLTAMLDDRFHRGKFDEVSDRADAPIEDALAMLVRERLTGQAPPAAAKRLVELWRPLIEDRAGKRARPARKPDRGSGAVRRRRPRPARLARHGRGPHLRLRRGGGRGGRPGPPEGRDRRGRRGRRDRRRRSLDRRFRGCRRGHVGIDLRGFGRDDGGDVRRRRDGRQRSAGGGAAPGPARPERAARAGIPPVRHPLRRDRGCRRTVRGRGARPAARLSRQAALEPPGRGRAARQPFAAPADGAAKSRVGVRSRRRGCSTPRGCRASSWIRCTRCRSSARRTPPSATPW